MEQYLQPIMEYFRHHPTMGIFFAFLIALIESLPLLGTLFPGSVTMTAIGALIGAGALPPIQTCIAAVLGAFLGDCLGFWLGSRFHAKIRSVWPFNKLKKYLAYSEKFFAKHGGKSIIIGRFIGPTRAAMPLIAGLLLYTWKQFLPAAIFAAILWSLIYMAPGIALGALAMEFSHGEMTKVFFSGLAVIVALWLMFWLLQFFFKQLSRAINLKIQQWWNWLNQHNANVFTRLIRNQQHPNDYRQLKLALLFVLCAVAFLLIWFDVSHSQFLTQINRPLFYFSQSFRGHTIDKFWAILSILGTPEALLITSLLAALGLAIYRQWRASVHLLLVGVITAAAVEIIKKIYFSGRPLGLLTVDPSSSFPSGHTTMSLAVLGFLAFLTVKVISKGWRQLVYGFFTLFIFLISISRLALGQHWFTDILGSWFLGLSVLLLVTLSYRRMPKTQSLLQIKKTHWFLILLISAAIPWIGAGWLTFKKSIQESQFIWPNTSLNFQQWWQEPAKLVPLYRDDRFGKIVEPFNVQWAGNLDNIQNFLLNRGWELVAKRSRVYSTLERFTSHEPEYNIPLLARLYQNKPPEAFFIKHLQNSPDILELRLWQSGIKFNDSPLPLWLGVLTYHIPPEKIFLFPHYYVHLQSGNVLVNSYPQFNGFTFQMVHVPQEQQPDNIRAQNWDGDIFVVSETGPGNKP